MTAATLTPPPRPSSPPLSRVRGLVYIHRFMAAEYHELVRIGFLMVYDPVELLEGYLVLKMPRSPALDAVVRAVAERFFRVVPDQYTVNSRYAATLDDSEPEPDAGIARGPEATFRTRHPGPADTLLLVESAVS